MTVVVSSSMTYYL